MTADARFKFVETTITDVTDIVLCQIYIRSCVLAVSLIVVCTPWLRSRGIELISTVHNPYQTIAILGILDFNKFKVNKGFNEVFKDRAKIVFDPVTDF